MICMKCLELFLLQVRDVLLKLCDVVHLEEQFTFGAVEFFGQPHLSFSILDVPGLTSQRFSQVC